MPSLEFPGSCELDEAAEDCRIRSQQAQAKKDRGQDKGKGYPCRGYERPVRGAFPDEVDGNQNPQEKERSTRCSHREHGIESLHTGETTLSRTRQAAPNEGVVNGSFG